MAATTRVTWLCACVRYWPYRGDSVVYFLTGIVCLGFSHRGKIIGRSVRRYQCYLQWEVKISIFLLTLSHGPFLLLKWWNEQQNLPKYPTLNCGVFCHVTNDNMPSLGVIAGNGISPRIHVLSVLAWSFI